MRFVAGYLAESPRDVVRLFCCISNSWARALSHPQMNLCWREFFELKWAAFYDALIYQAIEDWRSAYLETATGRLEVTLEIFDREKKIGFAMSAMPARVQYKASNDTFIARYISASPVRPEPIPCVESHRLRFCPASVRSDLRPGLVEEAHDDMHGGPLSPKSPKKASSSRHEAYPYTVLEGTEGLVVGRGVELQWKMQENSPFGWWYGDLEALHYERDGKLATATLTFRHFPRTSPWYRLDVKFGDHEKRDCMFGGKTGGMRPVSDEEHLRWMKHFPTSPIVF
jgi:hypothetical protein